MPSSPSSALVSAGDLLAQQPRPVFLDATLTLKPGEPDGAMRFARRHIAGARFFDLNQICDSHRSLPRMLPGRAQLAQHLRQFEISSDTQVVVYDQDGLYSAPRAWWMLRCAGHAGVRVLDGGLAAWIAAGGALASGEDAPLPSVLEQAVEPASTGSRLADHREVGQALADSGCAVLDARSRGRFTGEVPERNASLKSGHMPGAFNLPYTELVSEEGTLVSKAALVEALAARGLGVQDQRQWISSCGSGVTACIFALAMEHYFSIQVKVYDGSWSEWGQGQVGEVVTGEPRVEAVPGS